MTAEKLRNSKGIFSRHSPRKKRKIRVLPRPEDSSTSETTLSTEESAGTPKKRYEEMNRHEKRKQTLERKEREKIVFFEKQGGSWEQLGLKIEEDLKNAAYTIISYDEKPGVQAIGVTAPDLSPRPGLYSSIARDFEYVRHGTVDILAGMDLVSGRVHALFRDGHCSKDFIEWLKFVDSEYPSDFKIVLLLDNLSAHTSAEVREWLNTHPGRFEFVFTPKHASWLNEIECFFATMTRTVLRGIRVRNRDELIERLKSYIARINLSPMSYLWSYGVNDM